jgi:apolipoprotein N-acyltransferase
MTKKITDKTIEELRLDLVNKESTRPGNDAWLVSRKFIILKIFILIISAIAFASAFPPFNLSFFAWVAFLPLIFVVYRSKPLNAALYGYLWGWIYGVFSLLWLREIEVPIPFFMASYVALYPALWTITIPFLYKRFLNPAEKRTRFFWLKEIFFMASIAGWWCILEWIRSWFLSGFAWNFAAVTQWQNIPIIQMAEYTGIYGISFLLIFVNLALFLSIGIIRSAINQGRYCRPAPFFCALVLVIIFVIIGAKSLTCFNKNSKNNDGATAKISIALIQANIPQCRFPKPGIAEFALKQHIDLGRMAALLNPDIIAWPETAVPVSYLSGDNFGYQYRFDVYKLVSESNIPLIFGTLDYDQDFSKYKNTEDIPEFNSVFMVDTKGQIVDKYRKHHLVPFGEYTPLGKYYPDLKRKLGMGRDLTPGKQFTIFELKKNVRAGTQICYEDIFPYLSRKLTLKGANLLMVFSNDAWYPTSSEPEQHMANSVFRAVENRRPMVRVGNNSCSCLILENGAIADSISVVSGDDGIILKPELQSRAFAKFEITVAKNPSLTFYSRYGDVFIFICSLVFGLIFAIALWNWRADQELILEKLQNK